MAKLSKKLADAVDEQEGSTSFEALPEGPYTATLREVKTDGSGPSGPYWTWEFEITEPETFSSRRLWVNTSLSEKALWKLKEMFSAFGYDAHSDTDELIGDSVKLAVTQRVIEKGSRKGELGNSVDRVMALGDADDGDDDSDDSVF